MAWNNVNDLNISQGEIALSSDINRIVENLKYFEDYHIPVKEKFSLTTNGALDTYTIKTGLINADEFSSYFKLKLIKTVGSSSRTVTILFNDEPALTETISGGQTKEMVIENTSIPFSMNGSLIEYEIKIQNHTDGSTYECELIVGNHRSSIIRSLSL